MQGYILRIPAGIPKTVWACKTTVDDYSWENRNSADMIEFSICSASNRNLEIEASKSLHIQGTTLSCHIGNTQIVSSAKTGVEVEIASIAVSFPRIEAKLCEFKESDFKDNSVLLIPLLLEHLPQKVLSEVEYLFHQYIHSYVEQTASSEMLCRSIVYELLYRMDAMARKEITKKDKYTYYYVKKANSMIENRYTEQLTLKQIANELGITPNYLSAIYKASTGIGFSDRLYEIRIKKAEQLLRDEKISISEIAERVGLGDKSNLRKRFKQYFGVSMREYRSIAKEQTLYHEKPMRKNKNEA